MSFLVTHCSCPVQQGLLITDLQKVLSPLARQPVALAVDTAWTAKAAAVPPERIIYFPSQECKAFPLIYYILCTLCIAFSFSSYLFTQFALQTCCEVGQQMKVKNFSELVFLFFVEHCIINNQPNLCLNLMNLFLAHKRCASLSF